jgi:hypothetical protein
MGQFTSLTGRFLENLIVLEKSLLKGMTTDLARQNSDFPYSLACLACSKQHSSDTMSAF